MIQTQEVKAEITEQRNGKLQILLNLTKEQINALCLQRGRMPKSLISMVEVV